MQNLLPANRSKNVGLSREYSGIFRHNDRKPDISPAYVHNEPIYSYSTIIYQHFHNMNERFDTIYAQNGYAEIQELSLTYRTKAPIS